MRTLIAIESRPKARSSLIVSLAVIGAALSLMSVACSDKDSQAATPTLAATETAAATPTPAPSPTPSPKPLATPTPSLSAAEKLAQTAGYFLFTTRTGDTYISIAGLFNGEPGTAKAGYPDQIRSVNNGGSGEPAPATTLAIPMLPTPRHIIPSAGLALAFQSTLMLEPGASLLAAYAGKVALHRVEFAASNAGFRMEYWLSDAATLSSTGAFNKDALQTTPLMSVACGSLAATPSSTTNAFVRNGVSCSVTALQGATTTPAQLAAGLAVATQGP
jgi:hypothetical protein